MTLLPIIGTNGNSEIEKEIIDFAICLPSNLPCSIEPKSIITISSTSTISVFRPDELGRISYIPPPPSLQLQTSTITSTLFCSVSKSFLNDLMNTSDISYNPQSWPILGGYTSLQPQNCSDILITGHADGLVYFWDISSIQFNLLYAINVSNFSQSSDVAIQTVDLCITSRILAISCKTGETFIFFFRLKPSIITQALNLKSSSAGVPQVTSRSAISDKLQDNNNNNNNIVQMNNNNNINHNNFVEQESRAIQMPISQVEARNENPKVEEQSEERTRSKSKALSPTVKSEPKFNWEQFFIAASIDAASAKNYAKKFEENKITEDLIFELDNDMMDIAGVTIGGDKIRILKFIKLCKNDPTLLAPFKEKKKKRKKKHSENDPDRPRRHRDPNRPSRSKKEKETDSSSESPSSITPRSSNGNLVELSNNNNNNNIIAVVANNNNINSSSNNNLNNLNNNSNNNSNNNIANMSNSNVNKNNQSKQENPDVKVDLLINSEENISEMTLKSYKDGMMPAGFQLKVQYSFKNQISRIRIASSLSKFEILHLFYYYYYYYYFYY